MDSQICVIAKAWWLRKQFHLRRQMELRKVTSTLRRSALLDLPCIFDPSPGLFRLAVNGAGFESAASQASQCRVIEITRAAGVRNLRVDHPAIDADQELQFGNAFN